MNLPNDFISVFFFLFPGIMVGSFYNLLRQKSYPPKGIYVFEVFLFAVLMNFLLQPVCSFVGCSLVITPDSGLSDFSLNELKWFLFSFSISFIVAVVLSWISMKDYFLRFCRKIKVTDRTSNGEPWEDAFLTYKDTFVAVYMEGSILWGRPQYVSSSLKEAQVSLKYPRVVEEQYIKENLPEPVASLILSNSNIHRVDFFNMKEENSDESKKK